jgi:uncharacterized Zn-finger protein
LAATEASRCRAVIIAGHSNEQGPVSMGNGSAAKENPIQSNAEKSYEVMRSDLPLSCPMPGMYLWNSHPKVYLPIESEKSAKCPYCGAEYVLID